MRALTPGSGSYLNEADGNDPYWKEDFYGEHYQWPKSVKEKYDLDDVFYCWRRVGSVLGKKYRMKKDMDRCVKHLDPLPTFVIFMIVIRFWLWISIPLSSLILFVYEILYEKVLLVTI